MFNWKLSFSGDISRLILKKLAELDLITKTPRNSDPNKKGSETDFFNSKLIPSEKPMNYDANNNIDYEIKELLKTTGNSLINDEELFSVKKIAVNK